MPAATSPDDAVQDSIQDTSAQDSDSQATVRVVSWNLWWQFGEWEKRQPAISTALQQAAPDLIGLQETWSDQVEALAQKLQMHRTYADHDGRDFGNAVLSRWPISTTARIALPGADGKPGHRSAVLAYVESPTGRMVMASTHFEHRFDQSELRTAQAAALAQFVAKRRGNPEREFPAIVAADLNALPESDEVRSLVGLGSAPAPGLVFTDTWSQVGEGPGHTYSEDNPHVVDSAWPNRRLDYVLVSWPRPRPRGNPVRAQLIGTRPTEGIVPSDHYGVMVDLRL